MRQVALPIDPASLPASVVLDDRHYIGAPQKAELTYHDDFGVIVFNAPASRHLPPKRWLELSRWCLLGANNGGSRQWARASAWLREQRPDVTTVVSYSDPSVGHTGALYRACNWLWAPTWQRVAPPPSGNGTWGDGKVRSVKDRWVFPLLSDAERQAILGFKNDGIRRRFPWAEYREPRHRRGFPVQGTGGGNWQRFVADVSDVCPMK